MSSYTCVNVGIGTIVTGVKELSQFVQGSTDGSNGKILITYAVIVSYENLGIARLIYHLPTTLCETFLHEVFKQD